MLRPALAEVADEMIEAVRDRPGLRPPARGPVRRRAAGRGPGGAAALPRRDRGGRARSRARTSTWRSAAARCAPAAASSRCSAPTGSGARVAWRRFAAAGVAAGLEPQTLYLLAESIFAYIDVLSAESAEGHALEQSAAAGEAELRRRRLVRLLVREPPVDAGAVEAAASEAGWPLPRTLAALAIGGEQRERGRRAAAGRTRSPRRSGSSPARSCPTPTGRAGAARSSGRSREAGAVAGLGTTVGWPEAALSFARARGALALAAGTPVLVVARERAGELLLRSDPRLAAGAGRRPAGAAGRAARRARGAPDRDVARVAGRAGPPGPVARRLGVHPQTARYRAGAAARAVRDALDDPDQRFWLELALQGRGPTGGSGSRREGPDFGLRRRLGCERDLRTERPGGQLVVPRRTRPGSGNGRSCGGGTRSSRGHPSTGTSPSSISNQDICVIL